MILPQPRCRYQTIVSIAMQVVAVILVFDTIIGVQGLSPVRNIANIKGKVRLTTFRETRNTFSAYSDAIH